jgi:hypothetical protein
MFFTRQKQIMFEKKTKKFCRPQFWEDGVTGQNGRIAPKAAESACRPSTGPVCRSKINVLEVIAK